ncbi:MAG: hypothetical protein S4CHLAM123_07030 [Chlamydiales bacterium]|nr:hypothetical protein [Chlamydiales bacterium]
MSQPTASVFFSRCDQLAEYYSVMGVPMQQSEGPLGGKTFSAYVNQNGQFFKVSCTTKVSTLTYGVLEISSRASGSDFQKCWFKSVKKGSKNGTFTLTGPIGATTYKVTLPTSQTFNFLHSSAD